MQSVVEEDSESASECSYLDMSVTEFGEQPKKD